MTDHLLLFCKMIKILQTDVPALRSLNISLILLIGLVGFSTSVRFRTRSTSDDFFFILNQYWIISLDSIGFVTTLNVSQISVSFWNHIILCLHESCDGKVSWKTTHEIFCENWMSTLHFAFQSEGIAMVTNNFLLGSGVTLQWQQRLDGLPWWLMFYGWVLPWWPRLCAMCLWYIMYGW